MTPLATKREFETPPDLDLTQVFFFHSTYSQPKSFQMADFFTQHYANVIESNESAWASKLINHCMLPTVSIEQQLQLESKGVVFLNDHPGHFDSYTKKFVHVKLPSGWKYVQPSRQDPRHINLLDQSGTKVAGIFIKYGGYDQDAYIHLV